MYVTPFLSLVISPNSILSSVSNRGQSAMVGDLNVYLSLHVIVVSIVYRYLPLMPSLDKAAGLIFTILDRCVHRSDGLVSIYLCSKLLEPLKHIQEALRNSTVQSTAFPSSQVEHALMQGSEVVERTLRGRSFVCCRRRNLLVGGITGDRRAQVGHQYH